MAHLHMHVRRKHNAGVRTAVASADEENMVEALAGWMQERAGGRVEGVQPSPVQQVAHLAAPEAIGTIEALIK